MEISKLDGIWTNNDEIKSLSDYQKGVNEVVSKFFDDEPVHAFKTKSQYINERSIWFRGHAKAKYENLPAIYRSETWNNSEHSYQEECNLFSSFKRKCKTQRSSDFEFLHLMQHYGLPTRLLDFTESSLTGLFFAIRKPDEVDDPHVWMIDPFNFNYVFQQEMTVRFMYSIPNDSKLWDYIHPKSSLYNNIPELPIAVYPSFYDDRVVAQRSVFVLFGKIMEPIEKLATTNPWLKIAKLKIDGISCHKILDELSLACVDHYSIFPDLEGISQQIKNEFTFKGMVTDNGMKLSDYD
jgi:hypothetical protein